MFQNSNREYKSHQRWCALVVLVAVCSLTVSLATRYTSVEHSAPAVSTLHKHLSPTPSQQRLMKSAATWYPPVVCAALLNPPTFYPRISPAGPPMTSVLFGKTLYNRPPPSSHFSA